MNQPRTAQNSQKCSFFFSKNRSFFGVKDCWRRHFFSGNVLSQSAQNLEQVVFEHYALPEKVVRSDNFDIFNCKLFWVDESGKQGPKFFRT